MCVQQEQTIFIEFLHAATEKKFAKSICDPNNKIAKKY